MILSMYLPLARRLLIYACYVVKSAALTSMVRGIKTLYGYHKYFKINNLF